MNWRSVGKTNPSRRVDSAAASPEAQRSRARGAPLRRGYGGQPSRLRLACQPKRLGAKAGASGESRTPTECALNALPLPVGVRTQELIGGESGAELRHSPP